MIDEVEEIAPGTSATLNLDLDAGTYAVLCNLPGHYANGMHAAFTVG
ncbi:MAG: plastocyanin/azurin family copper-binding protein [Actinomycetota bacterium]